MSAAIWLVSTMVALAGLFVLLDAQFMAIIQILVYAGAIMVLFLFVIMLLNLDTAPSDLRGPGAWIAGTVMGASLLTELMVLRRYSPERLALEFTGPAPDRSIGGLSRRRGRQRGHGRSREWWAPIAQPLFAQCWCRSS